MERIGYSFFLSRQVRQQGKSRTTKYGILNVQFLGEGSRSIGGVYKGKQCKFFVKMISRKILYRNQEIEGGGGGGELAAGWFFQQPDISAKVWSSSSEMALNFSFSWTNSSAKKNWKIVIRGKTTNRFSFILFISNVGQ